MHYIYLLNLLTNTIMRTNSVQAFIRFFIFIVFFGLFSIIEFVLPSVLFSPETVALLMVPLLILNAFISGILSKMFYVLPEWQRLVLLKLGKYVGTKGPGVFLVPPFVYSIASIIDVRITTHKVEATATLTNDNVPTKVTAAIEMQVDDPQKAIINVQNYHSSVTWLATEALKNTIGRLDLKELLASRDKIALDLKEQIDDEAAIYGINVRAVRITDIDTPPSLVEELAVIARAKRSAQAKQIEAQAEILVAEKIAEAAELLAKTPGGLKLREIQNMSEMSKEESSTIIIYPYGDETGRNIASATAGSMIQP